MAADQEPRLEELSDEELRAVAAGRGLVLGRSLSRMQLLGLLSAEGGGEEQAEGEGSELEAAGAGSFVLPTATMARLYAEQGHPEQAAEVCRAVLARRPDDRRARALLARLAELPAEPARARTVVPAASGYRAASPAAPAAAQGEPRSGAMVVLVAVAPSRLHACWHLPGPSLESARGHAPPGASLVLRIFSAWRARGGVRRRTADSGASPTGAAFVEGCARGAFHRAAVGFLSTEGRFVPVAHSEVAESPPGEPSRPRRQVAVALPVRPARSPVGSTGAAAEILARRPAMSLPWERGAPAWPEPAASPEPPAGPARLPAAVGSSRA